MQKKSFILLLILNALIGVLSCEKEVKWNAPTSDSHQLVVEGILTNELKNQIIILSYSKNNLNDVSTKVSNATVKVKSGDETYKFINIDSLPGYYFSEKPFAASVSKTYYLQVSLNGNIYTASTQMTAIHPTPELIVAPNEDSSYFQINYVCSNYSPDEEALYEIQIFADTIISSTDTCAKALQYYYTFNTVDIGEIFAPDRPALLFDSSAVIIERKYSLTPDYADFVRAMISETQWQGTFFRNFQPICQAI